MKHHLSKQIVGIDLGDLKHVISVLDRDSRKIVQESTITNHRESLRRLSQKFPGALIALEVGAHSPWITRLLQDLGHEVLVTNPRKLRAIYQNDRKSDLYDARMLAKLAAFDSEMLYPIKHQSEQAQRDLWQIKLRDSLVRRRVVVDVVGEVTDGGFPSACWLELDVPFRLRGEGAVLVEVGVVGFESLTDEAAEAGSEWFEVDEEFVGLFGANEGLGLASS